MRETRRLNFRGGGWVPFLKPGYATRLSISKNATSIRAGKRLQ